MIVDFEEKDVGEIRQECVLFEFFFEKLRLFHPLAHCLQCSY